MSRWLVGSSRIARSGFATSSLARATRRSLAARERRDPPLRIRETEIAHDRERLVLALPAPEPLDGVAEPRLLLREALVLGRVVASADPLAERVEARARRVPVGEALEHDLADRAPGIEDGLLLEVFDGGFAAARDASAVGGLDSGEHTAEGALAGAVAADEADLLAAADRERDVFEERPVGDDLAKTDDVENGHQSFAMISLPSFSRPAFTSSRENPGRTEGDPADAHAPRAA